MASFASSAPRVAHASTPGPIKRWAKQKEYAFGLKTINTDPYSLYKWNPFVQSFIFGLVFCAEPSFSILLQSAHCKAKTIEKIVADQNLNKQIKQ